MPLVYYRQRWEDATRQRNRCQHSLNWYSHARLITFLAGLLISLLISVWSGWGGLITAGIFLALFFWLVARYRGLSLEEQAQLSRIGLYQRGIARLEDRWQTESKSKWHQPAPADHPYAADLDIFGPGSLFELLHLGWTPMGRDCLSRWLLQPATHTDTASRQRAVQELTPLQQEREAICIHAYDLHLLEADRLISWADETPPAFPAWERRLTELFVILHAVVLAAWLGGYISGYFELIAAMGLAYWAYRLSPRTTTTLRGLERQAERLKRLAGLFGYLEGIPRKAALLQELQAAWKQQKLLASSAITELSAYAQRLEWPRNAFFIPLALLLLWWTRLAFRVADWRKHYGPQVRKWLAALGELESLHSLATFAFERPAYVYPQLSHSGRTLVAKELGHPLLPARICQCNDVTLGEQPQLLLISGSNMSGKSTLLRTVGINVVLGRMGAPVKAASMELSELLPGATLRIQDSLQSGISRFYAEILRLKQVLEMAQTTSLLFLLDEILSGTNSAERRQGASAILKALLDRGAIGLATTHDLALTEIAESWKPRACNMHLADTWQHEKIHFDYKLKPGIVSHGNALALMRAVGLQV